jgi:hypothetical protein
MRTWTPLLVLLATGACSRSHSGDTPARTCDTIREHLATLAAGHSDLDRAATAGWADRCTTFSEPEQRCLAASQSVPGAYACIASRLNAELADAPRFGAKDVHPSSDPACDALWRHRVDLAVAEDKDHTLTKAEHEDVLAMAADVFAKECPSYSAERRACLTRASTVDAFLGCR